MKFFIEIGIEIGGKIQVVNELNYCGYIIIFSVVMDFLKIVVCLLLISYVFQEWMKFDRYSCGKVSSMTVLINYVAGVRNNNAVDFWFISRRLLISALPFLV